MEMTTVALLAGVGLAVLLFSGVWISIALIGAGLIALWVGTSTPAGDILATRVWGSSTSWTLTALPLFIWMGEILYRTKLSEQLFAGLSPLVRRLPGRLLHVNIFGSGIFAAACGSTAATVATVGRISLPELDQRGYNVRMSMGSLAAAGGLGIMIPPSITFIVYGAAAEVSVARLFIAGILPGLSLVLLMSGFIIIWAMWTKPIVRTDREGVKPGSNIRAAIGLIPVILLITIIIGSIYTGMATPTEAGAVGVVGALIISAVSGTLTWTNLVDSVSGAIRTGCMIGFIILAAVFLTVAMSFVGLPHWIAAGVASAGLSPYALIALLTVIFIILGCFLDGISIVLLATSLLLPTVTQAGFDLIWFGVYLVLVVEMSMITPPIGLNLFVVQGLTNRSLGEISAAAAPFFLILLCFVVVLVLVPGIATFLPSQL